MILFLGDYERGEGSMGQRIMQIKTERLTNGRIMAAAGQGQLLCGHGAAADESMCLERAQVTYTHARTHARSRTPTEPADIHEDPAAPSSTTGPSTCWVEDHRPSRSRVLVDDRHEPRALRRHRDTPRSKI